MASNITNKTKDDSPQKKDQPPSNKFAPKRGQNAQKSPVAPDGGRAKNLDRDNLINPQPIVDQQAAPRNSILSDGLEFDKSAADKDGKEKATARPRRPTNPGNLLIDANVDYTVDMAPASCSNSSNRNRTSTVIHKFSAGNERGSSQNENKAKGVSDTKTKSYPKSFRDSAGPSSGGKGAKHPPNTSRQSGVKTSHDFDYPDSSELK